ncbi:MAG: DUF3592 domain-containing protein [Thermomonas sp.]
MDTLFHPESKTFPFRHLVGYVAAWLGLALIFGLLLSSLNLFRYHQLVENGVATTGRVLSLEELNHQTVHYTYRVGDQSYSGLGTLGEGNPKFEAIDVGDPVLIYYSTEKPSLSVLGRPDSRFKNELEAILLAALTIPAVLVGGFVRLYKRSRGIRS